MGQLCLFPIVVLHWAALGHHEQDVQEDGNQNQSDHEGALIAAGGHGEASGQLLIDDAHDSAQGASQTQHIRSALFVEHIDGEGSGEGVHEADAEAGDCTADEQGPEAGDDGGDELEEGQGDAEQQQLLLIKDLHQRPQQDGDDHGCKGGDSLQQLDHAGVFRERFHDGAQDGGGDGDSVLHTDDEQDSQFDTPTVVQFFDFHKEPPLLTFQRQQRAFSLTACPRIRMDLGGFP